MIFSDAVTILLQKLLVVVRADDGKLRLFFMFSCSFSILVCILYIIMSALLALCQQYYQHYFKDLNSELIINVMKMYLFARLQTAQSE